VEVNSTPSIRNLEEILLKKSKAWDRMNMPRGCVAVAAVLTGTQILVFWRQN
jgi:hypothetical protein